MNTRATENAEAKIRLIGISVLSACSALKIAVLVLRDYDRDGGVAHVHR